MVALASKNAICRWWFQMLFDRFLASSMFLASSLQLFCTFLLVPSSRNFLQVCYKVFCIESGVRRLWRVREFSARKGARSNWKWFKMRSERIQISSTMSNAARGASSGVSAQGCFRNTFFEHALISTFEVSAPFGRFWMPFWTRFNFEGSIR